MLLDVGNKDAIDQSVVDVLTSKVAVTLGVHHLLHASVHAEQGCIESTTTQVEDEPESVLLPSGHSVGDSSGNGFLNQLDVLEAGQTSSFYRSSLLGSIELGRNGDNNATAIIYASIGSKCLDDFCRELLRCEVLLEVLAVIDLDSAHSALELLEYVSGCCTTVPRLGCTEYLVGQFVGSCVACVNNALTGDGHDRRNGVLLRVALLDNRHAILHHGNGRVGCTEVNTSVDFSVVVHKDYIL